MNAAMYIKNEFKNYKKGVLFNAKKIYNKSFFNINEANYYKVLERLVKTGEIIRVSKGIYSIPKLTKYGPLNPSESEIIQTCIKNEEDGCEVNYGLYNKLGLTTQISKKRVFYCNSIIENQKKIGMIFFIKKSIIFTNKNIKYIEMLEVLQNFNKIQDLNYSSFYKYCMQFNEIYNEETFENIISKIKYKKSTFAFLEQILNHFKTKNNIKNQLSTLSNYKIPVWRISK